jgi:hypothetical protein
VSAERRAERRVEPPSGMPPPAATTMSDGTELDLAALAGAVAEVHLTRHPEDVERYGRELATAWCIHDVQHLINWAALDLDLSGQVAWLARVLDARGYPVANLADCLRTAGEVLAREHPRPAAQEVAARLTRVAGEL